MRLRFDALKAQEAYKLLTAAVVPRPIALVTTRNADGSVNAAPYSFFNVFSHNPPLMVLGLEVRPDSRLKDTARNIRENGVFVVNLVDENLLDSMVACATDFPEGESEPAALGLDLEAGEQVDVPHLAQAPFSFECRQVTVMRIGVQRDLAIGEAVAMRARDGLVDPETYRVNWDRYDPVGRLFATYYTRMGERLDRAIPTAEEVRHGGGKP